MLMLENMTVLGLKTGQRCAVRANVTMLRPTSQRYRGVKYQRCDIAIHRCDGLESFFFFFG